MRSSFTFRITRLLETAGAPRWAAPAVVGLGLAAALLEGAGLYLFIPLVGALGAAGEAGSTLEALFERALSPIPPDWRIPLLVGGLFVSIVLKNGIIHLNHYVTHYVEGLVAHRLRTLVMRQTVASCIDYRVENRRTDIVETITRNTWTLGAALMETYRMLVSGVTLTVFVALLFVISPGLTAVALLCFGSIAAVVHLVTRKAQTVGEEVVEQNRSFGLRMWESITGLRLIRSCAREEHEMSRFESESDNVRRRFLHMNVLWSIPAPASEVAVAFGIGALILLGHWAGIGLPSLAAFLALLTRTRGPVRELMSARVGFDSSYGAVADVADFLERTREPYLTSGSRTFRRLRHGIELREVTFQYVSDEPPALDNVSVTILRGRTTAIVGRSGAGKSTLLDLLFRFRDPTSGEVLVDGTPLPAFDLGSWRSRIALMSQDVYLFHDTVAVNIGFGGVDASPGEIRRAAEIAGAHEFIMGLPRGYDTIIGDSGVRLSGGQRQRIALARTILRDPEILLLDEATNALDQETERAFHEALEEYAEGRTVVVIAHRLSTVESADQILVLEEGRVVETGPPEALLVSDGPFARLHRGMKSKPRRLSEALPVQETEV